MAQGSICDQCTRVFAVHLIVVGTRWYFLAPVNEILLNFNFILNYNIIILIHPAILKLISNKKLSQMKY